jgi:outer membrane receptor protein involved in Fe transport
MPKCLLVSMLMLIGASRGAAQQPFQIAFAKPQPHFVAAWAPTMERAADRASVLARRVSLELTNVTLDSALKLLTARADLRITYSRAVLPAGRRVTLSANDIAVVTALTEMLFQSGLDVVVDRTGTLALVRCRHAVPAPAVQDSGRIVGRVTDKATGTPILGATVVVDGTNASTQTGADGRYVLRHMAAADYIVRARYIGYAPLTLTAVVVDNQETTLDFAIAKSAQELDQVVVTGTVIPTERKALPTPISVVSGEEIQQWNLQRVDQVFRGLVPGAVAWDQGSADFFSTVAVRGASSLDINTSIKTYIDGVEVSDPLFIATIDPNSVERVEITRGPQASTLYGSDASGGVLQIFTKKGAPSRQPQGVARLAYSALESRYSDGVPVRQDYLVNVSGGTSELTYGLGGSFMHTGEWTPEYHASSPSIFAGATLTQGRLSARLSARYVSKSWEAPFNPELSQYLFFSRPPRRAHDLDQQTVGVTLDYAVARNWTNELTLGYDRTANGFRITEPRRTVPADTFLMAARTGSDKASVRYNTSYRAQVDKRLEVTATAGMEHYEATRSSDVAVLATRSTGPIDGLHFVNDDRFSNTGYFGQAQVGVASTIFVTGGVRAERNGNFGAGFGTAWSPRVGISLVPRLSGTSVKIRASYGSSLRAPQPGQRDAIPQVAADQLANPGLGPERQAGWDVGVETYFGSVGSIGITYYRQIARDLIDLVFLSFTDRPQIQYQNVGRIRNRGWEVEGRLTAGKLGFTATYSRPTSTVQALGPSYAGDLRPGDELLNIPSSSGGASVTYSPTASTRLGSRFTYIGAWKGTDWIALDGYFYGSSAYRGSGRDYWITYPAIAKVDVSLMQAVSPSLTGILGIENVGNNLRYELTNDRVPLGRTVTVGAQMQF